MDQATRGVLKVARGVLEQLDTEQVLERVLDAAREVTGRVTPHSGCWISLAARSRVS